MNTIKKILSISILLISLSACNVLPDEFWEPPFEKFRVDKGLIKFYPLNSNSKEHIKDVQINEYTLLANDIKWNSGIAEFSEKVIHYADFPNGFYVSDSFGLDSSLKDFTFTFHIKRGSDTIITPILQFGDTENTLSLSMNEEKVVVMLKKGNISESHSFVIENGEQWTFLGLAIHNQKLYFSANSYVSAYVKWKDNNYDRGIPLNMDFELVPNSILSFGNINRQYLYSASWDDVRIYNRFLTYEEVGIIKDFIE